MSTFYDKYENAFSQLNADDVFAFAHEGYNYDGIDGTEINTTFPQIEREISHDCWKMARHLSCITHHTTEEWHDTIVVTLMSNLFPGFDSVDGES